MGTTNGNYNEEMLAVISGAMVYCDCAPKLPDDDVNSMKNNELYRELVTNRECPHGVFCEDEPLLHEKDCKPFINLKPFEICKSNYYISAMEDIVKNLRKNKGGKLSEYVGYLQAAKDQYAYPVSYGSYTCVLEVLDRWFEADDKHYVNNYFFVSDKIIKNINDLISQLTKILKKVRSEYEQSLPNIFEQIRGGLASGFAPDNNNNNESIDFIKIKKNGILDRLKKSYDKYNELKSFKENALKEFDQDQKLLLTNLDNIGTLLKSNIYFKNSAKGEFKEDVSLQSNKNALVELINTFKELININSIKINEMDDYSEFLEKFNDIVANIDNWLDDNKNLMESAFEFNTLSMDSFLVCRCGGIITIKKSGQEQQVLINKLEGNLKELLIYAEKHLYEQVERVYTYVDYNTGFMKEHINENKITFISAFNLVHSILLSMGGEGISQYEYNHDPIYEESDTKGAGVLVNIKPFSEVNKEKQGKAIEEGILTEIPIFGIMFAVTFGLRDIMEDNASIGGALGLIEGINEIETVNAGSNFTKFAGSILSTATHAVTWISILDNAYATTQLNHTAEITLTIVTSYCKFAYIGSYDIEGKLIKIIPPEFNDGNFTLKENVQAKEYFDKEEISYIVYQNGELIKGTETKNISD